MHRSRAPSIAPGTFFVAQPWADCITNMSGFNLRQAQGLATLKFDPIVSVQARTGGRVFDGTDRIGPIPKDCDITFSLANYHTLPAGAVVSWMVRNSGKEAEYKNDLGHRVGEGLLVSRDSAYRGEHHMDVAIKLNGLLIGSKRIPVIRLRNAKQEPATAGIYQAALTIQRCHARARTTGGGYVTMRRQPALALSRDLGLSYKSAFVLLHKLREAMAEEMKGRVVGGEGKVAEVDGGYFGGYVKPANLKEKRIDRRFARNQNGKREVVVIVRERGGNSVPAVFNSESQAASFIRARIAKGMVVHADEAGSWDNLHERFGVKRINHQEAYSQDGACTNWAEEYFSRLRRAEIGVHHHIAGAYLLRYAQESSWREDNRRVSNGDQVNRVAALAMKRGKSVDFTGYWQRHIQA
jgi:hypothetical protein